MFWTRLIPQCCQYVCFIVPTVRKITVCEGHQHHIHCQGDQKLEFITAVYGRSDTTTCKGWLDIIWNSNCHTNNALEIIKRQCEGLEECLIHPTIALYGDPCPLTKKYLEVGGRLMSIWYFVYFSMRKFCDFQIIDFRYSSST